LLSRYRIAYQTPSGEFEWTRVWSTDLAKVTGVTVGRLLEEDKDALAVAVAEASVIHVIDVSDPAVTPELMPVMGSTLGPNAVVAIGVGGDDQGPLHDLVTATVFNAPTENVLEILRNDGGMFMPLEELELEGQVNRANAVVLRKGAKPVAAALIRTEQGDTFQAADVSTGEVVEVLRIPGLPRGGNYLVGHFGSSPLATLVFYSSGEDTISVRSLTESGGQYQAGPERKFSLDGNIRILALLGEGENARLMAIYGGGARASIMALDPESGPRVLQTLESAQDEVFSGAVCLGDRFMALIRRPTAWASTFSQVWRLEGGNYVAGKTQEMTSIDLAVHLIEPLLRANAQGLTAAAMSGYTNTIPGTRVTYSMVPIPGGEFVMGTPATEPDRADNEGPQVRVKLDPFWMQTTEVTWDMYTLFMYPEEERKFRDSLPTEGISDRASDAVARPSKPYTEMSYGMGKDGFPAIAMTHFAANKFCQWLSAKTGHYYRLPTEAEWEYACRAGTTTPYSFGSSEDDLDEHAWYEMNSDFVYQRVGTKAPNPWGLYDMHGNVMEWCLDGFAPDYSSLAPVATNPWIRPTRPYPHVARGGSYDDPADRLRSGARQPSDRTWKMTDPQLPKSTFWLSDNKMVGLRVVRPLTVPEVEELARRWNPGTERD
jgi:formylglycine-generating enzyme required for sulfatase activity